MADELGPGTTRTAGFHSDAERLDQLELRLARLEARAASLNGGGYRRANPLTRNVLTVLALTGFVIGGAALVFLAWGALSLILMAVFFAFALNPAVEFFVCRGWRRGLAATAVFVLAVLAAAAVIALAGPPLVKQVKSFADGLPALSKGHGPLGFLERKYQVVEHIQHAVTSDSATKVALGVASTAVSFIVVSFLTFFMLLEGPMWVERLLKFVPEPRREQCENVGYGIYRAVGGFVTGNLVASLLGGSIATIVLLAVGVPFAIPLGLLVAFLDLIPILGAILAPIVLGLVSLTQGVTPAIIVVAAFFVYHQIEVYYLRPLIYGRAVELSPLAVLVAVVIGAELAGLLGTLMAIPVAAGIQVLIGEIGKERSATRERELLDAVHQTAG
jgi:predicted PurR-regulated permease PerM